MKKILAIFLAILVVVTTLVACGGNAAGNNGAGNSGTNPGSGNDVVKKNVYITECSTNYDADGKVISKTVLKEETKTTAVYYSEDAEGNSTLISKFTYLENGETSKIEYYGADGSVTSYQEYVYDESGKMVAQKNYRNGALNAVYNYDENRFCYKMVSYKDGKEIGYVEYDSSDAEIKRHKSYVITEDGAIESGTYEEEVYDESTRTSTVKSYNEVGGESIFYMTTVKVYDENGNMISRRMIAPEGSTVNGGKEALITFEYDEKGNPTKTSTYVDDVLTGWDEVTFKVKD